MLRRLAAMMAVLIPAIVGQCPAHEQAVFDCIDAMGVTSWAYFYAAQDNKYSSCPEPELTKILKQTCTNKRIYEDTKTERPCKKNERQSTCSSWHKQTGRCERWKNATACYAGACDAVQFPDGMNCPHFRELSSKYLDKGNEWYENWLQALCLPARNQVIKCLTKQDIQCTHTYGDILLRCEGFKKSWEDQLRKSPDELEKEFYKHKNSETHKFCNYDETDKMSTHICKQAGQDCPEEDYIVDNAFFNHEYCETVAKRDRCFRTCEDAWPLSVCGDKSKNDIKNCLCDETKAKGNTLPKYCEEKKKLRLRSLKHLLKRLARAWASRVRFL